LYACLYYLWNESDELYFYMREYAWKSFKLQRCVGCKLYFLLPKPTEHIFARVYDTTNLSNVFEQVFLQKYLVFL